MELFEDEPTSGNAPEFTVSELSGAVKRMIEGSFDHVRVRGEVGRVSRPRSGHIYLDLKDDRACLSGVIWKGQATRLDTQPEEGMEVIATGRMTTFPGQSKYQIVIESLAPAGVGALMAMLEKRRQALAAEGLFSEERKKRLPFLPEVIGVVTSPSGAVIRDILHRLRDRFPRRVLVWPVAVQGAACAPEVARAIAGFDALPRGGTIPRPDVLIVARGGGSVEDLWGFNEEAVVRAVANCSIPVISAVGHETDTTLIDHAADRRAPTPTAAAEIAVPVRRELMAWAEGQGARLSRALNQAVTARGQRLRDVSRALPRPEELTAGPRQRLDWAGSRLEAAMRQDGERRRSALRHAAAVLRPATLTARLRQERSRASTLSRALRREAATRYVASRRQAFDQRTGRFVALLIERIVTRERQRLEERARRAELATRRRTELLRNRMESIDRVRETAGYEATLARGYAVVWAGEHVVTRVAEAREAQALALQFADGRVDIGAGGSRKRRKPSQEPKQGTLL